MRQPPAFQEPRPAAALRESPLTCAPQPHPLVSTQCKACDNLTCGRGYYRQGECTNTVGGLTDASWHYCTLPECTVPLRHSSHHLTAWADLATPAHLPPTVCPALSTTATSAFGATWASTSQMRTRTAHARIVQARFTLSPDPRLRLRTLSPALTSMRPHAHAHSHQH